VKGAKNLGIWLEEKYGKDSIAMLVDEGSNAQYLWGQLFAMPAVAEKGMLDVEIKVETLGGHSSVPRMSLALISKDFSDEKRSTLVSVT
jgi:Gly-Xaa carboxypeptidase